MKLTKRGPIYLLHSLLILIGVVWIYPFIWMITASLKTNQEYMTGGWSLLPKKLQFANYARAWETAKFSTYFFNTVIVTVSVVLLVILMCSLTGYALGRYQFKGRLFIISAITATMFMPKGYTIIPVYALINALGLNNTLYGVILAEAGGAHILFILLFMAHFRGLPKELEEAAEMDGCGYIRTFVQVMLPLSKPIIATTAIMQFMWTWNSFLVPLIFTLNKPELRTLGVGMYQFVGEHSIDWTGMAAASSISLLPIIIVFLLFQRYFVEGVAGSVKG
ncbi:carbohydrate ABC transporter permease [Paenibacillus qinlingensis]|uniref:Raffinose/stachyose/melibiose transport system permease protein n=1 Tax=Paenibacillus qinlingensis TaxID=1837343 RepID=A0ABU1NTN3_9BACL|nr:carbohydrate ABC transporter permease [Paenibacillus qinlingensis]MDR6550842.1 raffinose/stachyose/melibiose transport system permease protein [Paenibacillus qinlingensis]